ncbi:hypothetical protein Bb109J_c1091 [Bdellovibrio bacteriovorus]|nr:hypothetical protein Bb109J_c1091 [Bdellovibrio bacteriovorus]
MGPLSELGPIDPQIGGLPALGLQDSLKYIASLVKEVPEAKDLFALYLNENFKMNYFGWTYRITESAVQYGTRLLSLNSKKTGITTGEAESIPHKLVMEYKDHSFVIDFTEAQNVFKNKIVQTGTKEIAVAEGLYSAISMLELALRFRWKKRMTLVGNPMNRSGIHLFNLTNK